MQYEYDFNIMAQRLIEMRQAKNLTQQELSQKTTVPLRTVMRLEKGDASVSNRQLVKLAKFYGRALQYFIPD